MASGKSVELNAIGKAQPVQVWPPPPVNPESRQARFKAATGKGEAYRSGKDRSLSGKQRRRGRRGS